LTLFPSRDSYIDSTIILVVTPCILVEVRVRFTLYLFLVYPVSDPENIGTTSSETSVNFYRTRRRHIFGHRYDKFLSNIIIFFIVTLEVTNGMELGTHEFQTSTLPTTAVMASTY
jgi:hypothetical protein